MYGNPWAWETVQRTPTFTDSPCPPDATDKHAKFTIGSCHAWYGKTMIAGSKHLILAMQAAGRQIG